MKIKHVMYKEQKDIDGLGRMHRIKYIDLYRGIGIILMILGHLHISDGFSKYIHAFHMPMFFFISGFFWKGAKSPFFVFIRKKAKSLLVPYILYWILNMIVRTVLTSKIITLDNFYHFLFEPTEGMSIASALWFLVALFFCEILYWFINRFIQSDIGITTVVAVVALFGNYATRILPARLPFAADIAFVGIGLYHVGRIVSNSKNLVIVKIREFGFIGNLILLFSLSILILCGKDINMRCGKYGNVLLFWINAIGMSIVLLNICRLLKENKRIGENRIFTLIEYIGENSLTYLALNILVIDSISQLADRLIISWLKIIPIQFAVTITALTVFDITKRKSLKILKRKKH